MKKMIIRSMLAMMAVATLSSCQPTSNEVKLFNGKDLSNWTLYVDDPAVNPQDIFKVVDGNIRIEGTPFGWMRTNERYTDYTLKAEWRWVGEASNSGIFINQQDQNACFPNAVECQLCAGKAGDFVLLGGSDVAEFVTPEGEERPSFPVVPKFKESNEKPAGEWNSAEIVVTSEGGIDVTINGLQQNRGSNSLHKEGFIGLQSEGKAIEFRNVVLIPLGGK